MSVNKELYRHLFKTVCDGMSLIRRGSSLRYELVLEDLGRKQWEKLQSMTNASSDELNGFYQGARGYFVPGKQKIEFDLPMIEVLPGEHLVAVFKKTEAETAFKIGLLKINDRQYIVSNEICPGFRKGQIVEIDSKATLRRFKECSLPLLGPVFLLDLYFEVPSPFHRVLDSAMLDGFRHHNIASDISLLYRQLSSFRENRMDKKDVKDLLDEFCEYGISTFCLRIMLDCLMKDEVLG